MFVATRIPEGKLSLFLLFSVSTSKHQPLVPAW